MLTAAHPFGELLDNIMREHDLNQTALADRLGYRGQAFISHVRTGHKAPPYNMARKLTRAFPELDGWAVYELIDDARERLGVTRPLWAMSLFGLADAA